MQGRGAPAARKRGGAAKRSEGGAGTASNKRSAPKGAGTASNKRGKSGAEVAGPSRKEEEQRKAREERERQQKAAQETRDRLQEENRKKKAEETQKKQAEKARKQAARAKTAQEEQTRKADKQAAAARKKSGLDDIITVVLRKEVFQYGEGTDDEGTMTMDMKPIKYKIQTPRGTQQLMRKAELILQVGGNFVNNVRKLIVHELNSGLQPRVNPDSALFVVPDLRNRAVVPIVFNADLAKVINRKKKELHVCMIADDEHVNAANRNNFSDDEEGGEHPKTLFGLSEGDHVEGHAAAGAGVFAATGVASPGSAVGSQEDHITQAPLFKALPSARNPGVNKARRRDGYGQSATEADISADDVNNALIRSGYEDQRSKPQGVAVLKAIVELLTLAEVGIPEDSCTDVWAEKNMGVNGLTMQQGFRVRGISLDHMPKRHGEAAAKTTEVSQSVAAATVLAAAIAGAGRTEAAAGAAASQLDEVEHSELACALDMCREACVTSDVRDVFERDGIDGTCVVGMLADEKSCTEWMKEDLKLSYPLRAGLLRLLQRWSAHGLPEIAEEEL